MVHNFLTYWFSFYIYSAVFYILNCVRSFFTTLSHMVGFINFTFYASGLRISHCLKVVNITAYRAYIWIIGSKFANLD